MTLPYFLFSAVPNITVPPSPPPPPQGQKTGKSETGQHLLGLRKAVRVHAGPCKAGAAHGIRVALERPYKIPSPRIPDLGGSWQFELKKKVPGGREMATVLYTGPRTVVGAADDPGPIRREASGGHRVSMRQLQSEGPAQLPDLRNVVDASSQDTPLKPINPKPLIPSLILLACRSGAARRDEAAAIRRESHMHLGKK